MHWTIGAIVYADDVEEAKEAAGGVFQDLTGEEGPFDYFTIFEERVYKANSAKGRAAVKQLMDATYRHFVENVTELKKALDWLSIEGAFSKAGDFDVRHRAYEIGKYQGGGIFLYSGDRCGIRNPEDLYMVLAKSTKEMPIGPLEWTPKIEIPDDVWIVLADVHT